MGNKTILITGINGFLGSHMAKTLILDYHIIGLENSLVNLKRINDLPVKIYASDINPEDIFKGNEIFAVIHAATLYRREGEPLENLINTNILLPIKLFELANKYNTAKFINTDSFFNNPNYKQTYLSDYTLSKKHSIEWLKLIPGKCKLVNMKLFHMYGGGDAPNKFVPQMVSLLQNNPKLIELTPGEQKRDFIFINDVVNAYRVVLEAQLEKHEAISEFEIGTGNSVSIREFMEILKKLTNSNTELGFGALPYRNNEIMNSIANNISIRSLGWNNNYSLIDGLTKTINSQC